MPGNPLTDATWAAEAADSVERIVATVRDTVTNRLVVALRAVVFGLIIAIVGVAVLVSALIVGTRLLQDLLELATGNYARSVWMSYIIMGGLLFLGGAICMRQRQTPVVEGVPAS